MKRLKNKITIFFEKLLLLNYLGLFFCEILSIKYYFFGRIGVVLWIFSWFLMFVYVLESLLIIFKKKLVFRGIALFSVIVLFNTVNPVNLSGETTQEIAGTLNHFKNSSDWGFRQTIMFGYPLRQFFFTGLFSLFFGKSQFFLNIGGALYFIFGLIIFAKGLLDYFGKNKNIEILTAIILAFIPHIYWLNHFVFLYEHTFFSFVFALMISGLFFSFVKNNSRKHLLLIGLILNYLVFSYTPGLAFVFFALLVGFYLLIKKKNNKNFFLIAFIIFVSIVYLLSSLEFRKDLNLIGKEIKREQIIKNILIGLRHLIFMDQGKPFVSPIFQTIFLITIFYSITSFKKIEVFFSGWWILMIIILSIISKGYTYYGIDFRLQRAMIIFPVLFSLIAKFLKEIKLNLKKESLITLLIFFIITGYFFQMDLLQKREPVRHLVFINFLREKVKEGVLNKSSRLIISNKFYYEYLSLQDSLQYFLPEMSYLFFDDYYKKENKNNINDVLVLTSDDFNNLIINKENIDVFKFRNDPPLFFIYDKD